MDETSNLRLAERNEKKAWLLGKLRHSSLSTQLRLMSAPFSVGIVVNPEVETMEATVTEA